MLAKEFTKKRRSPPPAMDHVLHSQDRYYGIDPSLTFGFNNPFNLPRPALKFQDLNEDVMVASNEGLTDEGDAESTAQNCYSPTETLSKSKQEKLSRDEATKIAGVDSLDESQLSRFTQDTNHLASISHPDVVHDIILRVFAPTVIMTISNACNNLPIRGKFVIHLDDENRPFLDWTHMSLHKVHEFLDVVKALTSPGSNESNAQKSELAVKISMNHLLDSNLAELSSTWHPLFCILTDKMHGWMEDKQSSTTALVGQQY